MDNLQIVIDAGHGGEDYGTIYGDIKEKDLTLEISKYMADQFRIHGVLTMLTRKDDETISPIERINKILSAPTNPKTLVISNHIDANENQVIYSLKNDNVLASNIVNEINKIDYCKKPFQRKLPSNNSKDYYYIMQKTPETIIIKYGFIKQGKYHDYINQIVLAILKTKKIKIMNKNTYIVKPGDSLWSIANKYNMKIDKLKDLNRLSSNTISFGQRLKLPEFNKYIVKSGDSLWNISKKYNTSIDTIKKTNNLTDDVVKINQEIIIKNTNNFGAL